MKPEPRPYVPKSPLDRWAHKLSEMAIRRGVQGKGFTTGQVSAVFLSLAGELAVLFGITENAFLEACVDAYERPLARKERRADPNQQMVVEYRSATSRERQSDH